MLKVYTHSDNYEKYERAVRNADAILEDWDYILVGDENTDFDNDINVIMFINKLSAYDIEHFTTEDGEKFLVFFH